MSKLISIHSTLLGAIIRSLFRPTKTSYTVKNIKYQIWEEECPFCVDGGCPYDVGCPREV